MGTNGMVSTGSVLASQAGAGVLADGGNAFDAAVAVCFVLGVVESYMTGPGGTGVAVGAEGRPWCPWGRRKTAASLRKRQRRCCGPERRS